MYICFFCVIVTVKCETEHVPIHLDRALGSQGSQPRYQDGCRVAGLAYKDFAIINKSLVTGSLALPAYVLPLNFHFTSVLRLGSLS